MNQESTMSALAADRASWEEYFDQLCILTQDVENRSSSTEEQEILLERINTAIESLHQVIFTVNSAKRDLEQVLVQFQSFAQLINGELVTATSRNPSTLAIYQLCPKKDTGSVGRPKYTIPEETLLSFRHLGYTWNEIASTLLVSRWTIKRCVEELGIKVITGYSFKLQFALSCLSSF